MKKLFIFLAACVISITGVAQSLSMWNNWGMDTVWVSGEDNEYLNIKMLPILGGQTYQIFTPLGGEPVPEFTWLLSPQGNDSWDGQTLSTPFKTLNKLATVIQAGDTALLRGGTYYFNEQQVWDDVDGTSSDTVKVWGYPGETPIFTKSGSYTPPTPVISARPLIAFVSTVYNYWRDIEISGYEQEADGDGWNGIYLRSGNDHNVFERINIHDGGGGMYVYNSGFNTFINCDFYRNEDPYTTNDYDNADGIGIAQNADVNDTNWVYGCRFWGNSDDGIDFFNNAGFVFVENCWSFNNGFQRGTYLEGGNGIGFKMGSGGTGTEADTIRQILNCISFGNRSSGFGEEEITSTASIYNSLAIYNATAGTGSSWGAGFEFNSSTIGHWIKNNISYGNNDDVDGPTNQTNVEYNDWDIPVTIDDDIWVSIDTTLFDDPRLTDGSLPYATTLFYPATGEPIIDAGIDIGFPFNGSAPDLGPKESNY